ncbi:GerMN domain-containing protein [Pontibacillus marinus]|uniref:Negative regulator of sigma-X activity n=1 Tax=Pontibacillus marinus BH030004 = DSM 16465 TaxID=1385511 RepID=A0A0A5FUP9_9BACI|nr:GerMN domain-containing protein [Pontibacillus marinus]KGX83614.1 hypothetical protein N783_01960 [Pontibacillus marinus BH030004 = DSM 16465]
MKQNKNYTEDDLQNLLQKMPEVEDSQTPDELYNKISSRLNSAKPDKTPFYKQPWVVTTISAAAVLLFLITTMSWLFDGTYNTANDGAESKDSSSEANMERFQEESESSASEGGDNSANGDSAGSQDQGKTFDSKADDGAQQNGDQNNKDANINSIAPSEGDESNSTESSEGNITSEENKKQEIGGHSKLEQSYVFPKRPHDKFATIALMGTNSDVVIPITIIAPPNWGSVNEVYNSIARSVKADEWGIQEYAFKDVTFNLKKDQNLVEANFPKSYSLPQEEIKEQNLLYALKEMFRPHGIQKIQLQRDGNAGVNFPNMGVKKEIQIEALSGRAYMLYQNGENRPGFLAPVSIKDQTIANALNHMKKGLPAKNVKPVIPQNATFKSIKGQGETLQITLTNDSSFGDKPLAMIEAILLTAKSYGYKEVKFNNAPQQEYGYGAYNLNEAIQVPDLLNPKPFNFPPGTAP